MLLLYKEKLLNTIWKKIVPQKGALRLMYFVDGRTHDVPLLVSSKIIPVNLLYWKSVAILMHAVSHKLALPNVNNSTPVQG